MGYGISSRNHLLDYFLGKLLIVKIKSKVVNMLLKFVLVNVGNKMDSMSGAWVQKLVHLDTFCLHHIICGLLLIKSTVTGRHLWLNLERQGRAKHVWFYRGNNV
jgi:hypothetical protein